MKIEVWKGRDGSWFWHKAARNGQKTSDAEAFPTKGNAVRAAKMEIRATIKAYRHYDPAVPVQFTPLTPNEKTGGFEFMWY